MLDTRPSKKQQELFEFIDSFIKHHGYGPSYREVMRSLDYKSVSTVAVHVDNLIARGFLRKKDNSARSLEVVRAANQAQNDHIVWLTAEVKKRSLLEGTQAQKEAKILQQALGILSDGEQKTQNTPQQ